ncbi:probable glutamine-dependent NAD(+) synthetase [Tetranychus urticae]|uniref:Glutamine-dependent NAD(+) synthetase n=1 Tax=Tetranychus urticae TaxID=32264 RepID=T1K1L1_TETUR|nr:probable glutamine-dependent NAD(+) synthetase [Tetranychus urticae]
MSKIGVAVFTLNQLALDFVGNRDRIVKSIHIAKENGASLRVGPELEISGYSCEDAFFESDTVFHSWEIVAEIIQNDFRDIIIDLGMPVYKDGSLYNCRIILLNNKILMIRPKTKLADGGNYRESRWFTAWGDPTGSSIQWFPLPSFISVLTHQKYVPFGSDIILEIIQPDINYSVSESFAVKIGFEMCEEMWVADASNVSLFGEKGVHIIANGSGSYWEIRKLDRALDLMKTATSKSGGLYAFSNLIGCDGARICFYGRSLQVLNGKVVSKTTTTDTFLRDVDFAIYKLDPLDIINYRQQFNVRSLSHRNVGSRLNYYANQSKLSEPESGLVDYPKDLTISIFNFNLFQTPLSSNIPCHLESITPEQEIIMYGSLWLWDYLRRCHSWCKGFIVPLSGGLDSASVACLVYCMSSFIYKHAKNQSLIENDSEFMTSLTSILGTPFKNIKGPKDICRKLLRCVYLKTNYSGKASEERAERLAKLCGAEFYSVNFTEIYKSVDSLTSKALNRAVPKSIPLRLQNLQARLRMVLTYDLSECNRLVLASGNVDEALVGYLTKYDCSSADLNPIGSLSKRDLRRFLSYIKDKILTEDKEVLDLILNAIPSAELTGENQSDEDDLGLTYDELSLFGRLRRGEFGACGPYSLFCKLLENAEQYNQPSDPVILSNKVKRFFTLHARNRHKQTVLTPSLHAETFSPDDNRFDQRQFLFDTNWTLQFKTIDEKVAALQKAKEV